MSRWSKFPEVDGKRKCIVVDMDGTLVNVSSIRHLYIPSVQEDGSYTTVDFDEFHSRAVKCPAIWTTVDNVMNAWEFGYDVVIVTARSDKYEMLTRKWLRDYYIPHNAIFMRKEGDNRPDPEVKMDLLKEVQKTWYIARAYEDNPHVADAYEQEEIIVVVVPGWVE